jgi:hypothetical protein
MDIVFLLLRVSWLPKPVAFSEKKKLHASFFFLSLILKGGRNDMC